MKPNLKVGAALAAMSVVFSAAAQPQQTHSTHHGPAAQTKPSDNQGAAGTVSVYRSSFEEYRPFKDEPLKDWRKANDEVREAGGHVGLMKGEPAQLQGHGAHGAKQQNPPEQGKKQ